MAFAVKHSMPERVSALSESDQRIARDLHPVFGRAFQAQRGAVPDGVRLARIILAAFNEQLASQPVAKSSLASALMRGVIAREELKQEEGGSMSADEAAMKLAITKTSILKRYQKGQLIGWREARQNAVRFPLWQFADDNLLPGISEVLAVFNQVPWMDDWAKVVFFLNPLKSLGDKRPLDLLREGKTAPVVAAALTATE